MPRGFELPHMLLEDIFRLVSFQDKLRCEQVCREWKDLIRTELAPKSITIGLVHTTLAPENITIELIHWRALNQTADYPEFTVPVGQNAPDLPSPAHNFLAWLFRRTAGLDELVLRTVDCPLPCVQVFGYLVTGLSLQAGANFHGTLGTPGLCLNQYGVTMLWTLTDTSCVLVQKAKF